MSVEEERPALIEWMFSVLQLTLVHIHVSFLMPDRSRNIPPLLTHKNTLIVFKVLCAAARLLVQCIFVFKL